MGIIKSPGLNFILRYSFRLPKRGISEIQSKLVDGTVLFINFLWNCIDCIFPSTNSRIKRDLVNFETSKHIMTDIKMNVSFSLLFSLATDYFKKILPDFRHRFEIGEASICPSPEHILFGRQLALTLMRLQL